MNDLFGFEKLFPLEWSSCVCVCVCARRPGQHHTESFELCRWEGPTALFLHHLAFSSLSPSPHLVFLLCFFSPPSGSPFSLLKVFESAETWDSKDEKGWTPFSHRAFISLYWTSWQNSSVPVSLLLRSKSSFVAMSLCGRWQVRPVNLHFNVDGSRHSRCEYGWS